MELTPTTSYLTADDGTRLAVHTAGTAEGAGDPLVCLPGGPMLDSAYLRDLGGLAAHRTLTRLDLRGTGGSETPSAPASYRCDRQVADVEAVRRHARPRPARPARPLRRGQPRLPPTPRPIPTASSGSCW